MDTIERRATLSFRSDSGRDYLYDDVTGSIFPWNHAREAVLKSISGHEFESRRAELERSFGTEEIEAAVQFINHARQSLGAFFRTSSAHARLGPPAPEQLREHISNAAFQLLLIVTEDCNLRCKYCALSEVYPLNRTRTTRTMNIETACRAVDWFVGLVEPQIRRNPRKRFGLSLYGGEPLMNAPTVRGVLEYARDRYPGLFAPVMTTNGTLLTPKNVAMLVEHNVQLGISIDGPEAEHDRLRIDSRGKGSFARIAQNLAAIKRDYPEFWSANLSSVSVYDWGTDLDAVCDFFAENADNIPRSVFVNEVSPRNTDYYDSLTEERRRRAQERFARLRRQYKQTKIDGEKAGEYLTCAAGFPLVRTLLRQRAGDARTPFLPFTGTCVPGDKIAVHVDGKLDMCERVNGTYPIGHLDRGGLDYERIREIIAEYQQLIMQSCHGCPVTKFCNVCFSLVEKDGSFERSSPLCAGTVRATRQNLADYVSIMEANPSADFSLETDVSMLEKRLLFFY